MQTLGLQARQAARSLRSASGAAKAAALRAMADGLRERRAWLQAENEHDLRAAAERGLDAPMMDRLRLSDRALDLMIEGLLQIAAMPDPIGSLSETTTRPNGMRVARMRVPLGVIGIIYESRPNVTIDAAALCLKSGNATILRGGSEAFHSNRALGDGHPGRPAGRRPAPARGPGRGHHRPRRRGRDDHPPGMDRRHHPARRQGPDRPPGRRIARAPHQAPGRQLPRLCGQSGRPSPRLGHRGQRQDLPDRHLRRHGNPAGPRGSCPHLAAAAQAPA